ncbi:MAG: tryptophan halogenase family protein [Myxococcota bacterium]
MDNLIKDLLVLGGGTAGWMTAAYLHKTFGGQVRITLVEAASVPRIGVGEATVPNLQRAFWDFLGIPEDEWMRHCNAAFKTAVKFVNWRTPPAPGVTDHFYHTFGLVPNCDGIPLTHYWVEKRRQGFTGAMDYTCFKEPELLDARLSPKWLDGRDAMFHAWHFDATLVAEYLKTLATGWGVRHVVDELEGANLAPDGSIASLRMKSGATYAADFFVDCSGFRGLLINQALGEPFLDMSDHLFCDSAVATAVPHDDEKYGIEACTSAIAMRHGWTWKIPMMGRFGTGYVYSSRFCGVDEAADEFMKLWNLDPAETALNKIRFRVGRNRRAWVHNCASIGLASCFLEPLESTGIYFIYAAIYQLVKHFPEKTINPVLRDRFNMEIQNMFDDCRDFIQAHYLTSQRSDTEFWRANRHALKLSDNVQEKLETYKSGLPVNMPITTEENYYGNFEAEFRNYWTNGSYYCIFAGMGLVPDRPLPQVLYRPESRARAEKMFAEIRMKTQDLKARLPTTFQYLQRLHNRERGPSLKHLPYSAKRLAVAS